MEKNEGCCRGDEGEGGNDRKADSCGETKRMKITMKREARGKDEIEGEEKRREEIGKGERGRREKEGEMRETMLGRGVQLGCCTSNAERESM